MTCRMGTMAAVTAVGSTSATSQGVATPPYRGTIVPILLATLRRQIGVGSSVTPHGEDRRAAPVRSPAPPKVCSSGGTG